MVIPELSAVIYGLASAISWGAGDFTGGLASKRNNVFNVVIISQTVGALMILTMASLFQEPISMKKDLILGAFAGIAGAIGLVVFYRSLAHGQMGVVAPITAIVTAGLPVAFGLLIENLPRPQQMIGFLVALLSVWLISANGGKNRFELSKLYPPIIAGICFSGFFILIDQVTTGAVFWPLVAARMASLSFLYLVSQLRRVKLHPHPGQLPVIALAGLLDVGGNIFYTLAAQAGRLDIAAVLASLYPAATVLLASTVLREKLSIQQWLGILAALLAVMLIAT